MFEYHSQQIHSDFKNSKGRTKIQTVSIRGKKGKKTVQICDRSGRVTKKSSKSLTKKEMKCIQKCQFIPGLFRDCEKCLKPTKLIT
jgi:hypothetical protein